MGKALAWMLCLLAVFCLALGVAADSGSGGDGGWILIGQTPGADLLPRIALAPDGRATLVWKHYPGQDEPAQILLAQAPLWQPVVVTTTMPSVLERASFALVAQEHLTLAWSQSSTQTLAIYRYSQAPLARLWEQKEANQPFAFALDEQGGLHVAWAQPEAIHYLDSAQQLTVTLPLTTHVTVEELRLALDASRGPHLAWSLRSEEAHRAGIYYVSLREGTAPVRVATEGTDLKLAVGPDGRAHLAWQAADGLRYSNSQNWAAVRVVVPGRLAAGIWALAAGPGELAHLAWVQEGTLWHASSADWRASRKALGKVGGVLGVDLAVDVRGHPRVVWAAPEEDGDWQIHLLDLTRAAPQLRVVYPLGGMMLIAAGEARVEANLPASAWQEIAFYLQTKTSSGMGALLPLGVDRDGQDGWQAPLFLTGLDPHAHYRVVARGSTQDGQGAIAYGGWFTVQPQDRPWVWLLAPGEGAQQGKSFLSALVRNPENALRRLGLFLVPQPGAGDPTEAQAVYLGEYALPTQARWPAARWQRLEYDTRALPDGRYRAMLVAQDRSGRETYGFSEPLELENSLASQVQVVAPHQGAILSDVLEIVAQVKPMASPVERVDFYLERAQPLLATRYAGRAFTLDMPESLWLGSDTDGADGWGLRLPIREEMDGDTWYVCARAFDAQGRVACARSAGPVAILGRQRPLFWVSRPSAGQVLRGREQVRVVAYRGVAYVASVRAYAETPDGSLISLGLLQEDVGRWLLDWDTTALPDGPYALVIVSEAVKGYRGTVRVEDLTIANVGTPVYFRAPEPDAVLRGAVSIRLQTRSVISPSSELRLYCRDTAGQLRLIEQRSWGNERQCTLVWNTLGVLDGAYELVALLTDGRGETSRATRPVVVHNALPTVALQEFPAGVRQRGVVQVPWAWSSPVGRPLSATWEYSPDGGRHWIEVARGVTSTAPLRWNTVGYPDGPQGLLRVTVGDGLAYAQDVSDPFTVKNVNERPVLSLLAPQPGTPYAGQVPIAWYAADPDQDALRMDIEYRRGTGEWVTVARQLPNEGSFLWRTEDLAAGDDYEVRVIAQDIVGATAVESVTGVKLVEARPPTVYLLWPNGPARLEKEALILWHAASRDARRLLIDLYYSDNAGQTWIPLAEGIPNTGYYQWQTSFLPFGAQYRVRVVARDGVFRAQAESSNVFSIGPAIPPQPRFIAPEPQASLAGWQWIRWAVSDPERGPRTVSLAVRAVAGGAWQPVAWDIPDDGFYLWDTRQHADGEYELRLTVTNTLSLGSSEVVRLCTISNHKNHPPQGGLLAPAAGARWAGIQEVTWRAWDLDGDPITATLSLSVDRGNWLPLAKVDARQGYYLWDTRRAPSGSSYRLRLVVDDGRAQTEMVTPGAFYLQRETSLPRFVFTSPGPEGLRQGKIVSWVSQGATDVFLSLSLALSPDGGVTWQELAKGLRPQGEYTLDVTQWELGRSYILRLQGRSGGDVVQAFSPPFTLTWPGRETPSLEFVAPARGERWSGTREVRWRAQPIGSALRVDLEVSEDGGQSWTPLAQNVAPTGAFTWDTTSQADGFYLLRLVAWSEYGKIVRRSEPFYIENPRRNPPVVSLVQPRGGQVWSGTQEVRWRAEDADGDQLSINLAYSLDAGATWHLFAYGVANTGSYIWDTTTIPNCETVWMRVSASDGQFTRRHQSQEPFKVVNLSAPVIQLLSPLGGEEWFGQQNIVWRAASEGNRPLKVMVELSIDEGRNWQALATDLPAQGSLAWDTSTVPEEGRCLLRAIASDGMRRAIAQVAEPVTVRGNPVSTRPTPSAEEAAHFSYP